MNFMAKFMTANCIISKAITLFVVEQARSEQAGGNGDGDHPLQESPPAA